MAHLSCLYHASELELTWTSTRQHNRICRTGANQSAEALVAWLDYAQNTAPSRPRNGEQRRAISWFHCAGQTEYIEPLTGWGRHPYADVCYPKWSGEHHVLLEDTRYLVPSSARGPRQPPRGARTILFDAGCSGPNATNGQPTSVPFLVSLYERHGMAIDRIYAWELREHNPKLWWHGLSQRMRAITTFFNVGVEPEPAAIDAASVLGLIREVARPEDFVVLKLDIDHARTEMSIMRGIAEDPSLLQLVDELYYEAMWAWGPSERHTIMEKFWGPIARHQTVDEVLNLMVRLRKRGVRAHFWT